MGLTRTENSGSIDTTEYSLPANANYNSATTLQTTECALQIWLDLNALIAGDQYQMVIYEKCISGGTQRVVDTVTLTGAQGNPIYVYPYLHVANGWDVSLKKLLGTARTIAWSLRKSAP